MALEQHFGEQIAETMFDEQDIPLEMWKKIVDDHELAVEDNNPSGGFECNICLEVVHDPVVTFCGHLYCWPCIYKWIHSQSISSENHDHQQPQIQCPVCKAEVSQKTLIPLYGRGEAEKKSETKTKNLGIMIPQRPPSPRYESQTLIATTDSIPSQQLHSQTHQPYPSSYMASPMLSLGGSTMTTNMLHPIIGGMVNARLLGNSSTTLYPYPNPNSYSLAASGNLRMRRQLSQADKSLGRICFFLFCCFVTCLLLF